MSYNSTVIIQVPLAVAIAYYTFPDTFSENKGWYPSLLVIKVGVRSKRNPISMSGSIHLKMLR